MLPEIPAPILHLILDEPTSLGRTIPTILASEVEALLARRRAAWMPNLAAYQQRLAALDPITLYIGCLRSLAMRLEDFPPAWKSANIEFLNLLGSELIRLEEQAVGPHGLERLDELV